MIVRFFVTGASGFIGRALCRRLIAHGASVSAVVRAEDLTLTQLGVRVSIGDLWDDTPLYQAIDGAHYVIHCAGDATFGDGPQYLRSNIELTQRIVNFAAQQASLQRFVFVSTIGVIDRSQFDDCRYPLSDESEEMHPTSDYGRSKLEAEDRVRTSGVPFCIVRPGLVVGNEMRLNSHFAVFARQALGNHFIARIAWPGSFSVVHVEDVAAALHIAAIESEAEGRTVICAGESISLRKFYEFVSPNCWRMPLNWAQKLASWVTPALPFSVKVLILPALVADDSFLRRLGWRPSKSARDALEPVIARERARLNPEVSPGGQTVVTGAASGLGLALVEKLAPRRNQLLLVDRDRLGLERILVQYPHCRILVGDLSTARGVQEVVDSTEWRSHPVLEFFSCAGIGLRGGMKDIPAIEHRRMFEVNVLARIEMAQRALLDMKTRRLGRIVLISSSSAFQPLPYMATYAATNSALLSIGESWSAELSGTGVQLMTICPGGMRTNFQQSAGVRQLKGEALTSPNSVADAIFRNLSTHKMTLIISFRSHAMLWLARLIPRKITVHLWHYLMEKMR